MSDPVNKAVGATSDVESDFPQFSLHADHSVLASGVMAPPGVPGALGKVGRFPVLRVLGTGGMGIVVLGRDPQDDSEVAIKLLRPELRNEASCVHRFVTEARHMQQMSHPQILRVTEVGEDPQMPYYVMPYVRGGALSGTIPPGKGLEYAKAMRIVREVAEAMAYAHSRGLIHRDLKPANVLLGQDGSALLCDFGLARTMFNDSIVDARANQREGSAPYMSPAVAAGEAEDTRCDIYSLGAMLYHMLTGTPPYQGVDSADVLRKLRESPPPRILKANPQADAVLAGIAEGAMGRELRDRYATMRDVADDLERARKNQRPKGPRSDPYVWKKRIAVTISLAAILLTSTVIWVKSREQPVPPPRGIARTDGSYAWPPDDGRTGEVSRFAGHAGRIHSVTVHRTLPMAVTCGEDGLMVWDLSRREKKYVLIDTPAGTPYTASISADGGRVISGPYDNISRVWDVPLQKVIAYWPAVQGAPCALSADGKSAAYGGGTHFFAQVQDVSGNTSMREVRPSSIDHEATVMRFLPDGKRLLVAGGAGWLRVVDIESRTVPLSFAGFAEEAIRCLDVSDDGAYAVSGGDGGLVMLWDLRSGVLAGSVRLGTSPVRNITLLDDRRAVCWSDDRTMHAIDLAVGKIHWKVQADDPSIVSGAFSADGKAAILGDSSGAVRLWKLPPIPAASVTAHVLKGITIDGATERFRIAAHASRVWDARFSPDEKRIVTGGSDGVIHIVDVGKQQIIKTIRGHSTKSQFTLFSPTEDQILCGSGDGTIGLWDAKSAAQIHKWDAPEWTAVAFSRDGKRIGAAGANSGYFAKVFDAQTGALIRDFSRPEDENGYHQLTFSADGNAVLLAGYEGTLRLMDIATGRTLVDLRGHHWGVTYVDISEDGTRALSVGYDRTLRLWNLRTGEQILSKVISAEPIWRVQFITGSNHALTSGADGMIRRFDLADGKPLWQVHAGAILSHAVAFSRDGKLALIGDWMGGIRLWELPQNK